jgi:hypothetical protein
MAGIITMTDFQEGSPSHVIEDTSKRPEGQSSMGLPVGIYKRFEKF